MGKQSDFSQKLLRTQGNPPFSELCKLAGVESEITVDVERRFIDLPLTSIICDDLGHPMYAPTMFLTERSLRSRSVTGATAKTYGEGLICWFRFLKKRKIDPEEATEETLGMYRAALANGKQQGNENTYASSTSNLRVVTAAAFHEWAYKSGVLFSPLGSYLASSLRDSRAKRCYVRVIKRHPRVLSQEEISAILSHAKEPYRIMFHWALVTGARRFEICALRYDQLPNHDAIGYSSNGLITLSILRKGGRELPLAVPIHLLERTHWYCMAERPKAVVKESPLLFVNSKLRGISPSALSTEFRRCANLVNSDATLHMLRHTYATKVLDFLERAETGDRVSNPIKTLQVLLGHSRVETTELYVHSTSINSSAVYKALTFLYGITE